MNSIHCFCIQYNLDSLLKIPVNVNLSQPLQVVKATRFLNAIDDWQEPDDKTYFKWQEFIIRYGAKDKLESNSRLEDTLLISMNKHLWSEIESDMSGFPKQKQGAIQCSDALSREWQ